MAQDLKAAARDFYDAINRGDFSIIYDLIADNFINHEPSHLPPNKEGTRAFFHMMRGAFGDLRGNIEDIIQEDDKVVVRCTITGTQTGEFMGMPPSNKKVSFETVEILRVEDGKAVERWGVTDRASIMQQLAGNTSQPPRM